MKRNFILLGLASILFCFSFACKHSSSSTSATPEDYRNDCARLVGVDNGIGLITKSTYAYYYDTERIDQFSSNPSPSDDYALEQIAKKNASFEGILYPTYLKETDQSIYKELSETCQRLNDTNPSKYSLLAIIVNGTPDSHSHKTTCTYDIFDCDELTNIKSYTTEKVKFTVKDFIKEECRSGISIGKTTTINNSPDKQVRLLVKFPKPFNECFNYIQYKNYKFSTLRDKTVAMRVEYARILDSSEKKFLDIKNTKEFLDYEFEGYLDVMSAGHLD